MKQPIYSHVLQSMLNQMIGHECRMLKGACGALQVLLQVGSAGMKKAHIVGKAKQSPHADASLHSGI